VIDFDWFSLTWPKLDTVANWATIVLAFVALIFGLSNYLLFGGWWLFGYLKKTWPIEVEITSANMQVHALTGVRLSNVRVIIQATVRPYRYAWNPRRPIRIHEVFILFRGSRSSDLQLGNLEKIERTIERDTELLHMVVKIGVEQLNNSDQIALLRGEALTLEIVTTQSPRSRKIVRTSFKPSNVHYYVDGDATTDMQALIVNLEKPPGDETTPPTCK